MLTRPAGIGLILVLLIGIAGQRPATAAFADGAKTAEESGAATAQSASEDESADRTPGSVNVSTFFSDLAGKLVSSNVPANLLDGDLSPVSVFATGARLAGWLDDHGSATLPVEIGSAEFSRSFLEAYFQRAVERDAAVDDQVLGLRIKGRSHLTGQVRLAWPAADQPPGFILLFTGVCHSETDGLHEVVTLRNQAETKFEARKSFVWTDSGLETSPAVATAETHSKTVNINSSLPGFIGRIATDIAHDRADERRAQADAISSQHAAQRIARGFDERVDRRLAALRMFSQHLPAGGSLRGATRLAMSSSPRSLHFGLYRRNQADAAQTAWLMPDSCDAAIRLHRGVFELALADRTGLFVLGSVLLQCVANASQDLAQAVPRVDESHAAPGAHWRLARSADGEWLLMEHFSPRPAGNSSPIAMPRTVPASPVSQQRPVAY